MNPVINIENLGKKYFLHHEKQLPYETLRDVLSGLGKVSLASKEEFWALKDINLEINQGDRVGIIGGNGAGKSTLLKILSRIVEPTTGRATIRGRVASLLEVGTGFHPELTGRENIYLSGAVMGMSRLEIVKHFDAIIAFAETEKFLDTPVKRYSSGMYMRLAFAVSAHLNTDILLLDEVLTVGDIKFQEKCLGKMEDISKSGKTIIFVSHNIYAIQQFCNNAILLENGRLIEKGLTEKVLKKYLHEEHSAVSLWTNSGGQYSDLPVRALEFFIGDAEGNRIQNPIRNDIDYWIYIKADFESIDAGLTIGYCIYNSNGQCLYWSYHTDTNQSSWPSLQNGVNIIKSKFPKHYLNQDRYSIELIGGIHFKEWFYKPGGNVPVITIDIQGGLSDSPIWNDKRNGILAPVLPWFIH